MNAESSGDKKFQFKVTGDSSNQRLDLFLSSNAELNLSRNQIQKLIKDLKVLVNGQLPQKRLAIVDGDIIELTLPLPKDSKITAENIELDIRFEDEYLAVVNKPAGMVVHPAVGNRSGTLVNALMYHFENLAQGGGAERAGIVHRLDMDTSGVVVVAKHDAAHRRLAAQFKAHSVHRQYEGLVLGKGPGKNGTIDLPLARMRSNRFKRAVVEGGSRAVTHWRVLRRWGAITHIALRLETGRTHQIRVHLSHQGWPVLGDKLYGLNRQRGLGLEPELVELLEGLGREALHAAELGFEHPESGEALLFSTPPPRDMAEVMEGLASRFGGG